MSKPAKLDVHFSFGCTDLKKMVDFYVKYFGCVQKGPIGVAKNIPYIGIAVGHKEHEIQSTSLSVPNTNFYLDMISFQIPKGEHKNKEPKDFKDYGFSSGHLGFETDDIQKKFEEMVKDGVKFISPPQYSEKNKASIVFGYDPEGNIIELFQNH